MDKPVQADLVDGNDADQLLVEAARLRASAAFPQAVREYTVGLASFREAPRLINKLISYEARFRVTGYLLYVDADRETFGPGVTYGQLHELCTRRQEVSPRVLKTTLAMLKLTGFVKAVRSDTDRRSKFYRPTARMFDFVTRWLTYAVNSLDVLQPEAGRAWMLRHDPHFVRRFLVSGGRDHAAAQPPADRMPDFIGFFGSREGAAAVVLAAMQADIDNIPVPSRAHIAKRFGLSKTQVTNVINEGERIGFLILDDTGVPKSTQYLRDSYSIWISIELAFYARHMSKDITM
jgi:hypothetical protein